MAAIELKAPFLSGCVSGAYPRHIEHDLGRVGLMGYVSVSAIDFCSSSYFRPTKSTAMLSETYPVPELLALL